MSRLARAGALLFALGLAGCGAAGKSAPPPASAPSGGDAEETTPTFDSELKQREAEGEPERPAPGGEAGFAQPALASLDDAESLLERDSKDLARALGTARDCAVARKALDSMKRSADRICELNGPGDPGERCARARGRVEAASESVRRGCGS